MRRRRDKGSLSGAWRTSKVVGTVGPAGRSEDLVFWPGEARRWTLRLVVELILGFRLWQAPGRSAGGWERMAEGPRGRGVVFTCGRYFLWEQIRLGEGKCSVPGECRGARKMTPHTSAPTPTTTTNVHTQTGHLYTSCFIFLTCLLRWYSTRCIKVFPTIVIYLLPCMICVWLIVSCCFHLHLIAFLPVSSCSSSLIF